MTFEILLEYKGISLTDINSMSFVYFLDLYYYRIMKIQIENYHLSE